MKTVEELAIRGYVPAQYYLGYEYLNELAFRDVTNAVCWLTKAADKGFTPAIRELGKHFYKHNIMFPANGTREGIERAVSYLERAANKDDGEACYYLGECYECGIGVKGDKQEAQKWFRKAVGLLRPIAETGDTSACRVLAQCYSNGKGVEKDFDEGMRWMRKSIKDIAGKINGQRGVVK